MSINVEGTSGQNYTDYLRLVHTASIDTEVHVTVSSGSSSITHKVDRTLFFEGYGTSPFGIAPYGDYSSLFQFYLTVTENNPPASFSSSNEIDICFEIAGPSYSGKTAAEVSDIRIV